jgi:hypothetical protein
MNKTRIFGAILTALLFLTVSACGPENGDNNGQQPCQVDEDCSGDGICSPDDVCIERGASCENIFECEFGEYCTGEYCRPAACESSDDCVGDFICSESSNECRAGCESDDDCSGTQVCSSLTDTCEEPGCTPADCGEFEVCDDEFSPPECRLDGSCDPENSPELTCSDYTAQVGDGIERFCNEENNRCELVPPCESDDDCDAEGEICFINPDARNVCEEGCRSDEACGLGEVCGEDNKCVTGCSSDTQCQESEGPTYVCEEQVCKPSCDEREDCYILGPNSNADDGYACIQQICQRCENKNECFGGEVCDLTADETAPEGEEPVDDDGLGLCRPAPDPCPDDGYGDNHDQSNPYEITGTTLDATGDDAANYCRRNTAGEWFAFSADDGKVIDITIEYSGDGNLDVALLQPDGTEIVASARPPTEETPNQGVERIVYGVNAPGGSQNFLVQVRGTIVAQRVEYDLTIDVRDPMDCTGDSFEENDTPETAADLPGGNTFHDNLEVCGDDPDFYKLAIQSNQVVTIGMTAPARLGDVDLFLRKQDGTTVAESTTDGNTEEIEYNSEASEDLILEVQVANGVGRIEYDLAWEQEPNVCLDQYDPNETCADAPVVGPGDYQSLSVCAAGADFYAVDLDPLDQIRAEMVYDPTQAQGSFDFNLFGPNSVCSSVVVADAENVPNSPERKLVIQGSNQSHYTPAVGGRYYVRVGLSSGFQGDYSLNIDVIDGPDCVDDQFDTSGSSNDDSSSAVTLDKSDVVNNGPDSAILDLKVCDQNEDWYSISLDPGDEVEWRVQHEAQADIEAFIIDSDGSTELASSTSGNNPDTLTYQYPASETGSKTVYLKVNAAFTARATYRVLTYINGDGPADAQCPDTFENNDDAANATSLSTGSYDNLLSCSADEDWYSTQVAAGETLNVTGTFDSANGNINMVLYAEDGTTQLDQATSSGSPKQLSYTTFRTQTLYYKVEATGTGASVPYSLDVNIGAATSCTDDRFAGNVDAASAESVMAPGLYERLNKCDGGSDWFAVDLVQDQEFEAFIRYDASLADLDVKLWEGSPGSLTEVASATTTTDDDSFVFTPPADGTYFVEVLSKGTARNAYDLLLYEDVGGTPDVIDDGIDGPADRSCPDQFENNDSRPGGVTEIPAGNYDNLLICSSDRDYYSVFVPAGATLSVDLFFSHADSNIDAQIFRGTSTQPITGIGGTSNSDDESLSVTNNSGIGETYVIDVFGRGSDDAYYDMEIGLTFATACSEDSFGTASTPNFSQADAASISTGTYDLQLCESTEDWYEFSLGSGETVEANIELQNRLGNIDIELYDSGGVQMASATSDNTETIDFTASSAGTYYLRVFPRDGVFLRNAYDLWLSIAGNTPTAPYCPDAFERNDDALAAATLDFTQEPQRTDLIMCSIEQDWYAVNLTGGLTYDLKTFFDHTSDFDLAIEVRDAAGNVVQDTGMSDISFANDTDTDDALAKFTPASDGVYSIGIEQQGTDASAQGDYFLYFDSDSAACPEDGSESNGGPGSAASITEGVHEFASCASSSGDPDDYFSFQAPRAGTFVIDVYYDDSELTMNGLVDSLAPNMTSSTNRLTFSKSVSNGQTVLFALLNSSGSGPYFVDVRVE